MTDQATFKLRQVDGIEIVDVHGEVDLSNIDQFKAFLRTSGSSGTGPVIVSLEHAAYVDSHAIAALAEYSKRLSTTRRQLYVVARRDSAAGKILSITNLGLVIPLCESVEDALARAKGRSAGT